VFADLDSHFVESDGVHRHPDARAMRAGFQPIVHAIPVQLLAFHAAVTRGTDVDKPRNLAKA
jgi:glucosamine--fructose-6-phosphate aminotransferase (isomerizing)